MKKLILIILGVFASFSSFSQDPQLFENDWYLQKIIKDDVEYYPPINTEVDYVFLSFFPDYNFNTTVCQGISSDPLIIITYDLFTVESFVLLLDGDCDLPETVVFEEIYFNDFFDWQHANKTFNYNIETGADDIKTLILTNDVNYVAIYGNEILSEPSFDNLSFTIYPNPVKDVLQIKGQNIDTIETIKIFDISGKLVIEEKKDINQLDVSNLSSGLFILKVETNKRIFTQKIIKE